MLLLCFESYELRDALHPLYQRLLKAEKDVIEPCLLLNTTAVDEFLERCHRLASWNVGLMAFVTGRTAHEIVKGKGPVVEVLGMIWRRFMVRTGSIRIFSPEISSPLSFIKPALFAEFEHASSLSPFARLILRGSFFVIMLKGKTEIDEKVRRFFKGIRRPLVFEEIGSPTSIPAFCTLATTELAKVGDADLEDCRLVGSFGTDRLAIVSLRNDHQSIQLIHPSMAKWLRQSIVQPQHDQQQSQLNVKSCWLDDSISLSGWRPSQDATTLKASFLNDSPYSSQPASSQPSNQQHCKSRNKAALKKLILLSLRHLGIDKSHGEFGSIWKQLYCGCLFALRKELAIADIDQPTLLTVIKSNISFLNIQ